MEQREMKAQDLIDVGGSGVEDDRTSGSVRRRFAYEYARKQGLEIWDDLVRQYEEGIIPTLKELSHRIKDVTGVTVSLGTLSRHLNSGENRRMRKNRVLMARGYEDLTKEEILGPAPSEVKYRSLSRKLQNTLLTIGEEDGVRQYNRVTVSVDGSKEYFRCAFCYKCKRKTGTGAVAYLTVCEGRIVGNLHPQHHEDCQPMSEERAAIEAVDRQSRRDVRAGKKLPKDAHADGFERAVELARSSGGPPSRKFNMPAMFPPWSKVGHSYNRARKHALSRTQKGEAQDSIDVQRDPFPSDDFIDESHSPKKQRDAITDDMKEIIDPISSSPPPRISPAISTESINVDSGMISDSAYEPLPSATIPGVSRSASPGIDESLNHQMPPKIYATSKGQISPVPTTANSANFQQTYPTSPVRRHWLVRNPRTGRITVRKCVPPQVFCRNLMPGHVIIQSSAATPAQTATESIFGGRIVKANGDYLHAAVKREAIMSPVHDTANDDYLHEGPRGEAFISPVRDTTNMVSSSMHLSTRGCSLMNFETRRSYDAEATQEIHSEKSVDTLSAIEALLDKAAAKTRDEYDRIGESVADCMRKVCEGNASVGVKFKCELLQMMAKYEMMAINE
ncbi:hypothetical protein Tcan_13605 [Toxocara canis]|uniref:RYYR-CCHC domain-containing protein n=1 Tax=Toxocara canis TaxID=6265 RepID=A0A0B2VZJ7_TOXCA|nr:hypothetical protein Tcan_13605 [Toxocara canis]